MSQYRVKYAWTAGKDSGPTEGQTITLADGKITWGDVEKPIWGSTTAYGAPDCVVVPSDGNLIVYGIPPEWSRKADKQGALPPDFESKLRDLLNQVLPKSIGEAHVQLVLETVHHLEDPPQGTWGAEATPIGNSGDGEEEGSDDGS